MCVLTDDCCKRGVAQPTHRCPMQLREDREGSGSEAEAYAGSSDAHESHCNGRIALEGILAVLLLLGRRAAVDATQAEGQGLWSNHPSILRH